MAFALTPLLFSPLACVPEVGRFFALAIGLWAMASGAVALRVAFGYESAWDAVGLYVVAGAILFVPVMVVMLALVFWLSP